MWFKHLSTALEFWSFIDYFFKHKISVCRLQTKTGTFFYYWMFASLQALVRLKFEKQQVLFTSKLLPPFSINLCLFTLFAHPISHFLPALEKKTWTFISNSWMSTVTCRLYFVCTTKRRRPTASAVRCQSTLGTLSSLQVSCLRYKP